MSKLKAFDVGLGQYCEDGSPCVVAFDADRNPRLLNEKIYLKSEADKVIADLEESHKMEVEQLLMEIVKKDKWIAYAKALVLEDIKTIRHQKYKRCDAMARACMEM